MEKEEEEEEEEKVGRWSEEREGVGGMKGGIKGCRIIIMMIIIMIIIIIIRRRITTHITHRKKNTHT